MCKWNKWGDTRIDPCMRSFIQCLNKYIKKDFEILACCCGHGKYPMSIVCQHKNWKAPFDMVSDKNLHSKKKFYKRDAKGYYFLKEVHGKKAEENPNE